MRIAILASFFSNVLLLLLKGYLAFSTGSIAIIASAADSLLDLLSGLVLLYTQRVAFENVDRMRYPEGRARVEPIGIIVFSTVMCLSSLNILVESLRRLASGFDRKPEIHVDVIGYSVLIATIVVKLALFLLCRAALSTSSSSSSSSSSSLDSPSSASEQQEQGAIAGAAAVAAYAQDHFNDVLTNAVAVGAVVLAAEGRGLIGAGEHWWVTDAVGAAAISMWIMYSWLDVGKDHIEQLSGKVAGGIYLFIEKEPTNQPANQPTKQTD
jgi:cation diffusion facilitator family transporter